MDSSKISEECSSSESGWTMYIASPENEDDHAGKEDEDDDISEGERGGGCKRDVEDADSDDSMASDASSGPSYGYFGHAGKRDEKKCVDKKNNEEKTKKKKKNKHHEQIKAEKDKSGNRANSAGRSKKKV